MHASTTQVHGSLSVQQDLHSQGDLRVEGITHFGGGDSGGQCGSGDGGADAEAGGDGDGEGHGLPGEWDGAPGVSGTDTTKVLKAGDTMTGALALTAAGTGLNVTSNAVVGGILTVGDNVGIGTLSPGKALDVVGQGVFRAVPWAGAVPGVAGTVIGFDPISFGGLGFLWAHTTTGATTILWLDGNPIIFAPHAVERMCVDSDGNVGIGTTPKAKLHVAADIVAGSDVNGQKFIFHTRTNGGGDFLHITGDDANGSWQWNNGLDFKMNGEIHSFFAYHNTFITSHNGSQTMSAVFSDMRNKER